MAQHREFKLIDPNGGEFIAGDPAERALLLGRGYRDADETPTTASGDTATTPPVGDGQPPVAPVVEKTPVTAKSTPEKTPTK